MKFGKEIHLLFVVFCFGLLIGGCGEEEGMGSFFGDTGRIFSDFGNWNSNTPDISYGPGLSGDESIVSTRVQGYIYETLAPMPASLWYSKSASVPAGYGPAANVTVDLMFPRMQRVTTDGNGFFEFSGAFSAGASRYSVYTPPLSAVRRSSEGNIFLNCDTLAEPVSVHSAEELKIFPTAGTHRVLLSGGSAIFQLGGKKNGLWCSIDEPVQWSLVSSGNACFSGNVLYTVPSEDMELLEITAICGGKSVSRSMTVRGQENASLSGIVLDAEGTPAADLHLTLVCSIQGVYKSACSDGEGRYAFDSIPKGSYRVTLCNSQGQIYGQQDVAVAGVTENYIIGLDKKILNITAQPANLRFDYFKTQITMDLELHNLSGADVTLPAGRLKFSLLDVSSSGTVKNTAAEKWAYLSELTLPAGRSATVGSVCTFSLNDMGHFPQGDNYLFRAFVETGGFYPIAGCFAPELFDYQLEKSVLERLDPAENLLDKALKDAQAEKDISSALSSVETCFREAEKDLSRMHENPGRWLSDLRSLEEKLNVCRIVSSDSRIYWLQQVCSDLEQLQDRIRSRHARA